MRPTATNKHSRATISKRAHNWSAIESASIISNPTQRTSVFVKRLQVTPLTRGSIISIHRRDNQQVITNQHGLTLPIKRKVLRLRRKIMPPHFNTTMIKTSNNPA